MPTWAQSLATADTAQNASERGGYHVGVSATIRTDNATLQLFSDWKRNRWLAQGNTLPHAGFPSDEHWIAVILRAVTDQGVS